MLSKRVIPVLLLDGGGLYKTTKFKAKRYVGDPINTLKIFNEKEVDEIAILDISKKSKEFEPDYELLGEVASEGFMPMSYGGGISKIDQIARILRLGFEKIVINTHAYKDMGLITEASTRFGAQSIVGCVDVSRDLWGKRKILNQKKDLFIHIEELMLAGVGEIFINDVSREGTMTGYDVDLHKKIADKFSIPVVACGGSGSLGDVAKLLNETKCTGAAAGSQFVYFGQERSVLINYPDRARVRELVKDYY